MQSSNPTLTTNPFSRFRYTDTTMGVMTVHGTVVKTFALLLCSFCTAAFSWFLFFQNKGHVTPLLSSLTIGGVFIGFILAMITVFKTSWAPICAPLYALCEGFFLGGISATLALQFPGIAMQAIGLTFSALAAMLTLYATRIIKPTPALMTGIFIATGGVCIFYFIAMILGFFGIPVPLLYGNSLLSIGINLLVVGIAAFNFIVDFAVIEEGVRRGVPRYMEWYGAFTLMVTLVWLYVEFLLLLSKIRSRN